MAPILERAKVYLFFSVFVRILRSVSVSSARFRKRRNLKKRRIAIAIARVSRSAIFVCTLDERPRGVTRHSKEIGGKKLGYFFGFSDSARLLDAGRAASYRPNTRKDASVRSTDSRLRKAHAWRGVGRSGGSARRVPDVDADGIVRIVLGVTVLLVHLLDILQVRGLRGVVEEHVERQRLAGARMCLCINSRRRGDGFVVRRAAATSTGDALGRSGNARAPWASRARARTRGRPRPRGTTRRA